jgi:hypothetical protein
MTAGIRGMQRKGTPQLCHHVGRPEVLLGEAVSPTAVLDSLWAAAESAHTT